MKNIAFEVVRDKNIEQCRELCNELMAFQKSKAFMLPEKFDGMNFDTRMRKSYESALESQVIVVKDAGKPVGYAFSVIQKVEKGNYPDWAPVSSSGKIQGFYPDWDDLPPKVGCLNNLYFHAEYRGLGLGSQLLGMTMDWIGGFPDIDLVFIYISNGNDAALDFYLKNGFQYSHDVFGGFIKAVYRKGPFFPLRRC
jgi:ribosomal protein S18 acetylase RimI-like enzyme